VFTTHLDVHHVDDRYYETSDVAAFASHPNNASRSVVAGDLNTDEHERASFGPLVFQPFWSADVFHRDLASGGTFYANGTKPDWIFAGPNMGILNTGMLSSMNHALSDHYPLVANMAVG
jgi:endonuclease/exonuclease/phosphatase family metal-dependent hydrolase